MDYTMLDNGLLFSFFFFWFDVITAFCILRIAWLVFEKFLSIFQK